MDNTHPNPKSPCWVWSSTILTLTLTNVIRVLLALLAPILGGIWQLLE